MVDKDRQPADQANSGGSAEVVEVQDQHLDALTGFIRETWDPTATTAAVRKARSLAAAANPAAAGEPPPTFLMISSGRAIGHVGTIPIRVWDGGHERPAHWVKGLMVTPDHRNGPVGFLVLKEAVRELDCAMAMVVEPPARRLFEALGFHDSGALSNHLRVLRPGSFLSRLDVAAIGLSGTPSWTDRAVRLAQRSGMARLAGIAMAGTTGLWLAIAGRGGLGRRMHHGPALRISDIDSQELDNLWHRIRERSGAAPVRDGAYLHWRYTSEDGADYRAAAVYEDSELAGLGIVRAPSEDGDPRLKGIRVAVLSELLYPPERSDVGRAVVAAAERVSRSLEADALMASCSQPSTQKLLGRRAFLKIPGNVHFLAKAGRGAPSLPTEIGEWWLSRGDSSADEVF